MGHQYTLDSLTEELTVTQVNPLKHLYQKGDPDPNDIHAWKKCRFESYSNAYTTTTAIQWSQEQEGSSEKNPTEIG